MTDCLMLEIPWKLLFSIDKPLLMTTSHIRRLNAALLDTLCMNFDL